MGNQLPNLQLQILDTTIKSTTNAILLCNRGRWYLRADCLGALECYGMAVIYLASSTEITREIYWRMAVKGLEAAMLCALQIEDLTAFGEEFRECTAQLSGLPPENAAETLQKLINRYANV